MSSILYKHRPTCRLCESSRVELAVPIKASPIADEYISAEFLSRPQPKIPMDLYLCRECGHAQLLDVVDPNHLFRNYIYSTSISLGLAEHFRNYADTLAIRLNLKPQMLAVDIGSNDGTLLSFYAKKGLRVCGVDPARSIAADATARGIPTIPEFLTLPVAQRIVAEHGKANIVSANNVFAHSDLLPEMADCVATLLADDGVFTFEVSYLGDIVERFVFDTIFHEHLCYHSLLPLTRFFAAHGLHFFDVERVANKGGSIRGYVQKRGGPRQETESYKAMVAAEIPKKLNQPETYQRYSADIEQKKQALLSTLKQLKAEGKRIAGFGASATVTTLIYDFELGPWLEFLVDDNQKRHGLYSPGHHLPVRPPSALDDEKIDVVVVLAWQYATPIIKRHKGFLERGGSFLIPLVDLKWVTNQTSLI